MKKIGIFGGTFDPIHNGHLAMAGELKAALALDEMRLLPCHLPPHRQQPGVSSQLRAEMAEMAVLDCKDLSVDCRELNRHSPSYSIDTLIELREELNNEFGSNTSLTLCMGMDSLNSLTSWHRWDELLNYAHIAVVSRPGCEYPDASSEVGLWLLENQGSPDTIAAQAAGTVSVYQLSLLAISATDIRAQIAQGESPSALLPQRVWQCIKERGLYGRNEVRTY